MVDELGILIDKITLYKERANYPVGQHNSERIWLMGVYDLALAVRDALDGDFRGLRSMENIYNEALERNYEEIRKDYEKHGIEHLAPTRDEKREEEIN